MGTQADPSIVAPTTSPDQIFVVVANIVCSPGVFGFVMAALTAALMSTVDTLINATAAIFINDVYRPIKRLMDTNAKGNKLEDKQELFAARLSSIAITALGVAAVLAFKNFPTVYEAHGYFHSTLTPPLVVAIFMGVFWKRFSPAGVITTFVGGVALMILGARYPGVFIAPFDHGITMNPDRPYSYIRALYNILACTGVGVLVTCTTSLQEWVVAWFKSRPSGRTEMIGLSGFSTFAFILILFNGADLFLQVISVMIVIILVPTIVGYFVSYNKQTATEGLTSWSIDKARAMFKGSDPNDKIGAVIQVKFKVIEGDGTNIMFSESDMDRMAAKPGDLVYLSDKRKWLGGLKSIHSVYGKPHQDDEIVYLDDGQVAQGLFDHGRTLTAEKEM